MLNTHSREASLWNVFWLSPVLSFLPPLTPLALLVGVRELLRRMLSWDPCQRPYMHDVLHHPFLASLRRLGDLDLGAANHTG